MVSQDLAVCSTASCKKVAPHRARQAHRAAAHLKVLRQVQQMAALEIPAALAILEALVAHRMDKGPV